MPVAVTTIEGEYVLVHTKETQALFSSLPSIHHWYAPGIAPSRWFPPISHDQSVYHQPRLLPSLRRRQEKLGGRLRAGDN